MSGISGSFLARTTCYLQRILRNVRLEKSCGPRFIASNSRKPFQECIISTNYFVPRVHVQRFCCCLPDKHQYNSDGNKVTSEYLNNRLTVGSNDDATNYINQHSENLGNLSLLYERTIAKQEILPHTEFLGIEVFPEIFDQLPAKCTGCGAILQSENVNKPGFIPEKRNPGLLSKNLEGKLFMSESICTRCFSLKHYNKDALPMVSPKTISQFLTHISRRKALILYVVDIMDIPGSFVEDILNIIGKTKHIILVCNKADRLPVDGNPTHQIERVKKIISGEALKFGLEDANVREVCMVSARTGFGICDLVRTINKYWRQNSDLYIVGCNNSGKTSLFNLFVDLFAASRHLDNMLQRGTVSPSAGTTLSLLRYPVTKYRFLRLQDRLKSGYLEVNSKEKMREVELNDEIVDKEMTKYRESKATVQNAPKAISPYTLQLVTRQKDANLSWLYDTPGLYNNNQITHLLTNQELKLLNPGLWFVPRTVILRPGKVLFLGGLARLDYLDVKRMSIADPNKTEIVPKASQSIFFTIFASPNLPVHVTSVERADSLYDQHTGNELLKVPTGGKIRMKDFPELKGEVFEVPGVDWKRSAADVILSNVGWIAVTAGTGSIVKLKAYTPNGAGLYLREPALLATSVRQRGRRGMPYLGHVNHNMYQGTRKRSPALTKYFTEDYRGTSQWMEVAEKKRKQQRALLKFEKTKYHSKLKLGYSARSNPTRYLPNFYDDEEEAQLEARTSGRTTE